jgi:hypothetical protein
LGGLWAISPALQLSAAAYFIHFALFGFFSLDAAA